jgi:putative transposase
MMVSESGYYAWRKRPASQRECKDRELSENISKIFSESKKRYGSVRLHQALKKQGKNVGRNRVIRLMRENSLVAVGKRKFKSTTDSHTMAVAPNKLEQNFNVDSPDTAYAGDMTYVRTNEG